MSQRPRIAVLWCGHLRTWYHTFDNQRSNLFNHNSEYDFDHYVHTYPVISETGWDGVRGVNDPHYATPTSVYIDAARRLLNAREFVVASTHAADITMYQDTMTQTKGHGNLPASTLQYLKRARAWADFEASMCGYAGYLVMRFDVAFKAPLRLPAFNALNPSCYYTAWHDPRPNAVDDRFAFVTAGGEGFLKNCGVDACEYTAMQKGHFMPENALYYSAIKNNLTLQALSIQDAIKLVRFDTTNEADLAAFIAR